jgi:hypothetical protein
MLPAGDAALIVAAGRRWAAAESGVNPGQITSFCHVRRRPPVRLCRTSEVWKAGRSKGFAKDLRKDLSGFTDRGRLYRSAAAWHIKC